MSSEKNEKAGASDVQAVVSVVLEEINAELIVINERLIKINEELIAITESSMDYTKKCIEELGKAHAKISRSDIMITPILMSIGDSELKRFYKRFGNSVDKIIQSYTKEIESSPHLLHEPVNETRAALQDLLHYVYYLRDKMSSY